MYVNETGLSESSHLAKIQDKDQHHGQVILYDHEDGQQFTNPLLVNPVTLLISVN